MMAYGSTNNKNEKLECRRTLRTGAFYPASFARSWRSGMTAIRLRLPQSLHRKVSELAEREGISINQLISSAVAEKMSALMTEDYLEKRAARGSRRKFEAALAKVPDVAPDANDEMPPARKSRRKTQIS